MSITPIMCHTIDITWAV